MGITSVTPIIMGLFFRHCPGDRLEEIVRGARNGREWILRLLEDPCALRGLKEVVSVIHRRCWSSYGLDGFWTEGDSFSTGIQYLLERAEEKLDVTRSPAEVLHACVIWFYHAILNATSKERLEFEQLERDEELLLRVKNPDPDEVVIPHRGKWDKPSISKVMFANWR